MTKLPEDAFLQGLERQAKAQAVLEKNRVFPRQLDFFTAFVGTHTWQVLVVLSFATALLLEVLQ